MDIYKARSNWRLVLGFIAIILLAVTVVYSNFLANKLAENEQKSGELFNEALLEYDRNKDLQANFDLPIAITERFALPVILQNEQGDLKGENWCEKHINDTVFLQKKVDVFLKDGKVPLKGPAGYADRIFVFNSPTLQYIRYFPMVQVLLVSIFVLFGYFLFNASRRAEQNRVWAGMAKETAHQLGTPISAILGWIEYLKTMSEDNPEQQEVLQELIKDVDRLELVADRFSKIGSKPALKKINLLSEIIKCKNYMERRSPKKVSYEIKANPEEPIYVMINEHLFDWVIENLFRNSLDALDGQGEITIQLSTEGENAVIYLSDTGKGIPSSKYKSVFKPGYSTKQRGWGLGLSLAKRIIESYHRGKIFVKSSKVGEGTTFGIKLPQANLEL